MTKLAPIEEFTKFGMREHRGLTVFNDVELELVRQAIIKDFVSTLEPVAYRQHILVLIKGIESIEYGYSDFKVIIGVMMPFTHSLKIRMN